MHDLRAWGELAVEEQERIIGRTKLADIELDEKVKPTSAHNALTTINENGTEYQIVRDNMPFGRVGTAEFGTYFIGYCRTPRVTETMLQNMFVGNPPGSYDRLLDFSRPVTGSLYFVPTGTFLDNVSPDAPVAAAEKDPEPPSAASSATFVALRDTSLKIGSLKGEKE